MVNSSIGNSGLLMTRTLHRHKHQVRDFFNRHPCLRKLARSSRGKDSSVNCQWVVKCLIGLFTPSPLPFASIESTL
jgi:hypothetical protein